MGTPTSLRDGSSFLKASMFLWSIPNQAIVPSYPILQKALQISKKLHIQKIHTNPLHFTTYWKSWKPEKKNLPTPNPNPPNPPNPPIPEPQPPGPAGRGTAPPSSARRPRPRTPRAAWTWTWPPPQRRFHRWWSLFQEKRDEFPEKWWKNWGSHGIYHDFTVKSGDLCNRKWWFFHP